MAELLKPDLCVIGAGPAGLGVAAAAAAQGLSVVLIEKAAMGGVNLNTGSVPSNALLAAARRAHAVAQAPSFGVNAQSSGVDFAKLREHLRSAIAAVAPNDSKERLIGLGVRVIEGTATFVNRRTVAVGEAVTIRSRRFVIATGSVPAVPEVPGLAQTPYLTNETIFELAECPRHLIVIGATPVGLELAQSYRRLGAEVTVVDPGQPLANEDPECARIVLEALDGEGIVVRGGVAITGIENVDGTVRVALPDEQGTIAGTHLLVAAGRRPNVDGLGLNKARIRCTAQGIAVNARLRTRNRRVYAAGDVTGCAPFTAVARYQAGVVVRNTLRRWSQIRAEADSLPRVIFTDPELAQVGWTDTQARRGTVRVLRWPYSENDRAQAEANPRGHIKVITDRKGLILGATIVGANAGELIGAWSLAITKGLDITAFAGIPLPYPTLGDIGKRAAMTYFTGDSTGNWVRRIENLLRR